MSFNSKNGRKRSFCYQTKAPMLVIPMSRMSLWYPIMKRKEIIMWIHVCPNWQTNFDSKTWLEENLFLWKTKASMSFILIRRMSLWFLIMKERRLLCESMFILIYRQTSILKKGGKRSFSYEIRALIHYPNMENVFMVPNHEKKGDYYLNLHLS